MKNFNIVTLGASGAGKTVFLASMFKQLAIQDDDLGFFIEVEDPGLSSLLTNLYAKLAFERKWIEGNRRNQFFEFVFKCSVILKSQQIETG